MEEGKQVLCQPFVGRLILVSVVCAVTLLLWILRFPIGGLLSGRSFWSLEGVKKIIRTRQLKDIRNFF